MRMFDMYKMAEAVMEGKQIDFEEAKFLYSQPADELGALANKIREHYCSNRFDMCTIINGKSGRCSENCKFCAQSSHNCCNVEEYPLLPADEILRQAKYNHDRGVLRFSIVTSGKRLTEGEIDEICAVVSEIRTKVGISVCASLGLLDKGQFEKLKAAGVTRIHNNLETSRRFFPQICTTHTFEDKLAAIKAAQTAGLTVCSGGIMGLGETAEDRIDMALELRRLNIKSVPVNMLNPIPGTPLEDNARLSAEDMRRIAAVYRFILPDADIRLAGGRGLMADIGRGCFVSGANAAISGDMLTTAGVTIADDMRMLGELGYEVRNI